MYKKYAVIAGVLIITGIQSCSKKTLPTRTVEYPAVQTETRTDTIQVIKRTDSVVAKRKVVKRKPAESIPKMIAVNDKYAKKSVDGRYYYDLQGHRYWRNNNNGKYYLFNKSMLTDKAFKKPD